ncbi:hypothetical protein GGS26DRAFT_580163 [Hypomontagnella submonticulosa]|nr:hypothetical protein GGS26DRAFT_580163 [Hypomontagnella submonticulosa]
MSFSNPRRTPVTRPDSGCSHGLTVRTNNLTLRKGATFHSPVTPPTSPPSASTFKVPALPHRSQTTLDDVVGAHVRRAALNIGRFEVSLSATKAEPLSPISPSMDDTLPIPRGFLDHTIVSDTMSEEPSSYETERRVLRPRNRRSSRHHESDSGLGTSIASTNRKRKEGKPSMTGPSAITRSATASRSQNIQRLSDRAKNRIHEHVLKPLLDERSLKDFHPIVLDCPRMIQEDEIVCLRDLEKTLIFMAPVSQLMKDLGIWGVTYRGLWMKETAKTVDHYREFCLTSIRCIQATVEYLSDREQTRPHDRPYNNGYFIDLVEQIRQHAQQMQEARKRQAAGEELDDMDVDPTDEVKLVGGLTTNGRPAELVRVKKNGKAISIATGQPIEDLEEDEAKGPIRFKRSMSEQAEDEEEIMRSMARRKKNASPEELAPKKCTHVGCNKEFKRPCDLTKHEKTHSRPWKCPIPTCKYHDYGWPTEKEMDRHVNDKHSAAPPMFECHFKPCPYKSKRESNCKQHMEKAHGWTYVRTKTNGQKKSSKGGSSAHPTPLIKNLPTPSSEQTDLVMTPPDDSLFGRYNEHEFPSYPSDQEFNASLYEPPPFDGDIQLDFSPIDNSTPSTDSDQFNTFDDLSPEFTGQFEDIYGAPVHLPTPTHSIYNKDMHTFTNYAADLCQQVGMPHLSSTGQGNHVMLTPPTMVDEGFEDFQPACPNQFSQDFPLFPPSTMDKSNEFANSLFPAIPPSMAAGYSQPSSQDFNIEYNATMDWASEYQNFPN